MVFLPEVKARDVVIGLIVLVILITGAIYIRNNRKAKTSVVPLPTPNFELVESKFPGLTVPANADRVNLNKVDGAEGIGEVFKTFSNGKFNLTVMADLSAPDAGYFYQSWLVRGNVGDGNFAFVSMGEMSLAKGGYLTEFSADKDYSDYKKVVVTLERVFDNTSEQRILEGSF